MVARARRSDGLSGSVRLYALIAALAVGACASPPPGGDAAGGSEPGRSTEQGGPSADPRDELSLEILERVAAAEISGRSAGRPEDLNDPRFSDSPVAESPLPVPLPGMQEEATAQAADIRSGVVGETGADGGATLQVETLAAESAQPDGASPEASGTAEARRDAGDISDEQDFEAVTRRESIESDAERLKAQQTARIVYQPEPLPERTGRSNIILFALRTNHAVGEELYERVTILVFEPSVLRRCRAFPDAEAAQHAFLDAGGPHEDDLLIDPDGDGFVCGWDPEIYRTLFR